MMHLGKRPHPTHKLPSNGTGNSRATPSCSSGSQDVAWLESIMSTWWMLKNSIQLPFRKNKDGEVVFPSPYFNRIEVLIMFCHFTEGSFGCLINLQVVVQLSVFAVKKL